MAGGDCVAEEDIEPVCALGSEFGDIGILLFFGPAIETVKSGAYLSDYADYRIVSGCSVLSRLEACCRKLIPKFLLPCKFFMRVHQVRAAGRLGLHRNRTAVTDMCLSCLTVLCGHHDDAVGGL